MTTLDITPHAKSRRREMGVTEHEIERALTDPELVYPGGHGHPPGRTIYQHGRLVVVTEGQTVVTLLWHRMEGR